MLLFLIAISDGCFFNSDKGVFFRTFYALPFYRYFIFISSKRMFLLLVGYFYYGLFWVGLKEMVKRNVKVMTIFIEKRNWNYICVSFIILSHLIQVLLMQFYKKRPFRPEDSEIFWLMVFDNAKFKNNNQNIKWSRIITF